MQFQLVQDFDSCLNIVRSAAEWRTSNSVYSQYWDPELLTPEFLRKDFFDDQAWVLLADGDPVAAIFISEPSKRKIPTWEEDLGLEFKLDNCMYLDQIAVRQDLIGTGIFAHLLCEVEIYASSRSISSLRLDCDNTIPKLAETYKENGFKAVKKKDMGHRVSVFMEKKI